MHFTGRRRNLMKNTRSKGAAMEAAGENGEQTFVT